MLSKVGQPQWRKKMESVGIDVLPLVLLGKTAGSPGTKVSYTNKTPLKILKSKGLLYKGRFT